MEEEIAKQNTCQSFLTSLFVGWWFSLVSADSDVIVFFFSF